MTPSEIELLLQEATIACNEGRFCEALPVYEIFAPTGNIEAICGLSQMYLRGEGVEANVDRGLDLLRQAVDLGHALSAFNLGALHRTGAYGVPRNFALSKKYFLIAKQLGYERSVDEYL